MSKAWKDRLIAVLSWMALFALVALYAVGNANATTKPLPDPSATASAKAEQGQIQQQQQSVTGEQSQTATGGSADNNVQTTSNSTSKWKTPPIAMAGWASGPVDIDCRTVYGFDFRGAGNDAAGGATFGIPGRERKDCQFDRQAMRAFAIGDLQGGWQLYCSAPTNWQTEIDADAYRRDLPPPKKKVLGVFGKRDDYGRLTQGQAIKACMDRAQEPIDVAALVEQTRIETELDSYAACDEKIQRCEAEVRK